jgi:hypothetical protein
MTPRSVRIAIIALAATAAVAAPAVASQDLRSPDTRDRSAQPTTSTIDLRSPDAAEPFRAPAVDLRSPDAADPYSGVPVKVVTPAPVVHRVDSGFDWRDAGVGAAVPFALFLLVMGRVAITRRHKPVMG